MIEVEVSDDRITVTGHSGYAPPGQDIVCSAVSVLIQTLIFTIEQKEPGAIDCRLLPGDTEVLITYPSELTKTLIDAFFIGVNAVADAYPENVKIIR
ncbi:MAG: ribosomal-processing cysteine protease Prp [Bilifractor sp.]|jgi:uncharacterized protein YsxB (DUF464 family)